MMGGEGSRVELEEVIAAVQRDDGTGFCLRCGEECLGVEPDARRYRCDGCGELAVYGAEEILLGVVA